MAEGCFTALFFSQVKYEGNQISLEQEVYYSDFIEVFCQYEPLDSLLKIDSYDIHSGTYISGSEADTYEIDASSLIIESSYDPNPPSPGYGVILDNIYMDEISAIFTRDMTVQNIVD